METSKIIAQLKEVGFFEVYHKTLFKCYRERRAGGVQEVEVEIWDAGPDVEKESRYHVMAIAEDGKKATGNPAHSIDVAFAIVHWVNLD